MPQHYADQPTTPASVSAVDGVNVAEGMQRALVNNAMRAMVAMSKSNFAGDTGTITASSTFTLASISTGDYILMAPPSGGSITSFGQASNGLQKFLESTGTTILRNGASLSVQGGADLTLGAGDLVWARRRQSVWQARVHKADFLPGPLAASISVSTITANIGSISTLTGTSMSMSSVTAVSLSASVGNFQLLKVGGHGTVAQVVRDSNATYTTATTDLPCDNSIPQITEGTEILSVEITPVNASSIIRIRVTFMAGASSVGNGGAALFVDATAGALAATAFTVAGTGSFSPVTLEYTTSAASTTARTYRVRVGPDVGGPVSIKINGDSAARIFGGVAAATLEVEEILPQ